MTLPKEDDLCKSFMKHIAWFRSLNQFDQKFIIFHVANESKSGDRKKAMIFTKHLMAMGMLPGAPDYIVLYPKGKVAAIEFKRDKYSKLSDNQKEFKQSCEDIEVPYLCTYKIDEAIDWLKELVKKE